MKPFQFTKILPNVTKEAIWQAWADVNRWPEWDEDLESTQLDGSFEKGARFTLKPKGGPRVSIQLVEVTPFRSFTDITAFPLARMADVHEMEETDEGLKITSTIKVDGLLRRIWWKIVGEGVARGVPKQLESLEKYVRGRADEQPQK